MEEKITPHRKVKYLYGVKRIDKRLTNCKASKDQKQEG